MPFDPTKPVQTRDGRAVRILATDLGGADRPIVAAVANADGRERLWTYPTSGQYVSRETHVDLVNVPERQTRYYPLVAGYSSARAAGRHSGSRQLVAAVDFEDDTPVRARLA